MTEKTKQKETITADDLLRERKSDGVAGWVWTESDMPMKLPENELILKKKNAFFKVLSLSIFHWEIDSEWGRGLEICHTTHHPRSRCQFSICKFYADTDFSWDLTVGRAKSPKKELLCKEKNHHYYFGKLPAPGRALASNLSSLHGCSFILHSGLLALLWENIKSTTQRNVTYFIKSKV